MEREYDYGWVLEKAAMDCYSYVAKLVDGTVLKFNRCKLRSGWVTFFADRSPNELQRDLGVSDCYLGRGVCVPLDKILWVIDQDS